MKNLKKLNTKGYILLNIVIYISIISLIFIMVCNLYIELFNNFQKLYAEMEVLENGVIDSLVLKTSLLKGDNMKMRLGFNDIYKLTYDIKDDSSSSNIFKKTLYLKRIENEIYSCSNKVSKFKTSKDLYMKFDTSNSLFKIESVQNKDTKIKMSFKLRNYEQDL